MFLNSVSSVVSVINSKSFHRAARVCIGVPVGARPIEEEEHQ